MMSQYIDTYEQRDSRRPRRARTAIGLLLASTLLGGCGVASADPTPDTPKYPTPTPTATTGPLEKFQSPDSACTGIQDWMTDQRIKQEAARACLDLYEKTDVALVNYDLGSKKATQIATGIEDAIKTATDDLINVKVTVVKPSHAARALFKEQNPKDCIDIDAADYTEMYLGSYAAAATMSSLTPYDKIIGISAMPSCSGVWGGVADLGYNRYVDILEGTQGNKTAAIDTGAHELLHLFTLGHAGVVDQKVPLWKADKKPGKLDLTTYVKRGTLNEYGEWRNIMGGYPEADQLNAPQKELLDWPYEILAPGTKDSSSDLRVTTFRFDRHSDPDDFAEVSLDTPLQLHGEATEYGKTQEFNKLAIVPLYEKENGNVAGIDGFTLYAVSKESTVSLGDVWSSDAAKTTKHSFVIDGKTLSVKLSGDTLAARFK